jgi:hypothetical protein
MENEWHPENKGIVKLSQIEEKKPIESPVHSFHRANFVIFVSIPK